MFLFFMTAFQILVSKVVQRPQARDRGLPVREHSKKFVFCNNLCSVRH